MTRRHATPFIVTGLVVASVVSMSVAAIGAGRAQTSPRTVWDGVYTEDQARHALRVFKDAGTADLPKSERK